MLRLLLLALALLLAGCEASPQFANADLSYADFGKDFVLTDHNGKQRTLADFRGKAVVVFFGYTQCPDVCPTTLAEMAQALKLLGADADKVQVLFITVDPERDTRELLAQYVPHFNPAFLGLYGDEAATAKTAQEFHIFYKKQPGSTPATYTIDHTAGSYVYDPSGKLRLYVKYGEKPELIAGDLKLLLAGK